MASEILGPPNTALNTSFLVSGISNRFRFLASLKETSNMICDNADMVRASTHFESAVKIFEVAKHTCFRQELPNTPRCSNRGTNLGAFQIRAMLCQLEMASEQFCHLAALLST